MTTVNRIFQLIKGNKLNAKEFSEKVGISQGNLSDWKKGRSNPSIQALEKIARYFNVSVDYLLGNTEKPSLVETFYTYLRPLNLTNNQFNLFKELALYTYSNISNAKINETEKEAPKILDKYTLSFADKKKVAQALDIVVELGRDFNQTVTLNTIANILSGTNSEQTDLTNPEYFDNLVQKEMVDAILNLKASEIVDTSDDSNTLISQFYMCPVYGQISAGQPNWAEECIEGRLPLDTELMGIVNPQEHFFLRVNGESMNKIVKNGAFALIHKQDTVENGEIAVVLVDGNNATLKKFTKKNDVIVLTPESDDDSFDQQIYTKDTPVKVIGKYIGKMEFNK